MKIIKKIIIYLKYIWENMVLYSKYSFNNNLIDENIIINKRLIEIDNKNKSILFLEQEKKSFKFSPEIILDIIFYLLNKSEDSE